MKNKIYKIIIVVALLSFITSIGLVLAQDSDLQAGDYPTFGSNAPKAPTSVNIYLPRFIKYVYYFAIVVGGLVTLTTLIYGGLRFLTSAGNPAAITDARNQILSGFLGLIIVLGSFIILNEINPDLIDLQLPNVDAVRKGIILYNQDCPTLLSTLGLANLDLPELADVPGDDSIRWKALSNSGSTDIGKDNSNNDIYPSSFYSFNSADDLKIELHGTDNCSGKAVDTISLIENTCIDLPPEIKCMKFIWTTPGVWVFSQLDNGSAPDPQNLPMGWIEGIDYTRFTTTQDNVGGIFFDNIAAMALVPDIKAEVEYGTILHNMPGGMNKEKGWADIYLKGIKDCVPSTKDRKDIILCKTNNIAASSITIFLLPKPGTISFGYTKLCRNVRCERHQSGDELYSADYEIVPAVASVTNIGPSNIIHIENLKDKKWKEYNKPIKHRAYGFLTGRIPPDGVSAIILQNTSSHLVLLYQGNFKTIDDLNASNVDVAIINQSIIDLGNIKMDGEIGTVVIVATDTQL